ncbi:hypothetical protein C9374_008900 [Naegleria lovaniensis]|uniref:Uncharacterized protein n=1 Tax=Naegleria lovaniensis TaxID=51637 RepID=A0AA88KFH8_NAELO|nr:uncharacterized protein C9374_008900 [Naegleria lovaniensis]KAG2377815.1 hypothetical protein C9374_008900 [Naegleria lovaniensis]
MLFKLGFHNKSPVELLLENDDCTLEQILDEEDVISEAKAHYGKLIDFLSKSENLTKMIDYITIEIPLDQIQNLKNQTKSEETEKSDDATESEEVHLNEEKLQKRIFKYPRIAAEILCCDIDALYTAIASDKLLLTSLFDFISHEKQTLNPQLTNYWIRVVTCLVQRKPIEVHKFIMSQGESFVLNFCKHIGVPGMDELLLKLISCELYDLIISAETNRSAKQQLKLRLIDARDNSDATNVIKSSVKWWTDAQVPFKLIEKLSPQYSSECHINVTRVLSEIIRRSLQYNLDIQKLNPLATSILSDSVLCKLMDTLLENTDVLNEGIALLHTLIDTSVDLMDADFDECLPSAIKVILTKLPHFILASESQPLKKHLFVDCAIVERILQAFKVNEQAQNESKMRKGYMGHLTIISNTIVSTANSDETVASLTKDISGWKEFVETSLSERNMIETRQMGSDDSYLSLVGGVISNTNHTPISDDDRKELEDAFQDFDDDMTEEYKDDSAKELIEEKASTKDSSPLSESVQTNIEMQLEL